MTDPLSLTDAECINIAVAAERAMPGPRHEHVGAALFCALIRAGAASVPRSPPRSVRYTPLLGLIEQGEYSRIQGHALFRLGDCVQAWVNEGDILAHGERIDDAAPAQAPVLTDADVDAGIREAWRQVNPADSEYWVIQATERAIARHFYALGARHD